MHVILVRLNVSPVSVALTEALVINAVHVAPGAVQSPSNVFVATHVLSDVREREWGGREGGARITTFGDSPLRIRAR